MPAGEDMPLEHLTVDKVRDRVVAGRERRAAEEKNEAVIHPSAKAEGRLHRHQLRPRTDLAGGKHHRVKLKKESKSTWL